MYKRQAIYAALGSAQVNHYPVIEGLLNAVHLDHQIHLHPGFDDLTDLARGQRVDVTSWADPVQESSSGRIVQVNLVLHIDGAEFATMTERFAIRGRAFGTGTPDDPAQAGGALAEVIDTPRSTLSRQTVTAPANMTPFAWVSGDFNPIHTSQALSLIHI